MKKILVSDNVVDDLYWLVDESDIDDMCYFTGDENFYGWNGREMIRLSDCFVSEGDYEMLFEEVNEEDVEKFIESTDMSVELLEEGDYVEYDGCYYTPVDWVDFTDKVLTLEYDIKSEKHLVGSRTYDVDVEMMEVDVERVDYIPMDYPRQHYVNIYEGTDEDGKKIRITETHPFYAADHYPVSSLEYIE
jgi:hypothetical protein